MALTKVQTGGLAADSVDNTILDVAGNYAFTGTISGAGLSSPLGNDVTYTSDGSAVTQNLVQGIAKGWHTLDGTGTIHTIDSLNVSSVTDNGTGIYAINHNNDFSNGNYSSPCSSAYENAGKKTHTFDRTDGDNRSGGAGTHNVSAVRAGTESEIDTHWLNSAYFGDLA